MALPTEFLDLLRARVALSALVGRRVKLTAKGRGEFTGLCPFHQEKSPSFTVSDPKGFFHCFGCQAHGDHFDFVMRADNRDFMEAVEYLAVEAHLEVPKPTPEARAEAERRATVGSVLEAAAAFFAAQLQRPEGEVARAYLAGRGLDRNDIERFGIGYAPARRGLLIQTLGRDMPEPLLVEAGLVRRHEEHGLFDFFRDRIMFPILDRRGRVIGFGGRVLGDGKPKYLNSPDSALFHKGRELYGLSWARDGIAAGQKLLVTEGYMDVIALHRAGFTGAVAPLGTALTEDQLAILWGLAPEPVLCFDGDAAGQRAAARAVERALPLLGADRLVRIATLPPGEDPDSLIRHQGAAAMGRLIDAALPLSDYLFRIEHAAGAVDTPERRHALEVRLLAHAGRIADAGMRREFQRFFRDCLFRRLREKRSDPRGMRSRMPETEVVPPDPGQKGRQLQEALVYVVLAAPFLLDTEADQFGRLDFEAPNLDRLRREILNVHVTKPGLDMAGLAHHLTQRGFAEEVTALGTSRARTHARFAHSPDPETVLAGWRDLLAQWDRRCQGRADVEAAVGRFEHDPEGSLDLILALPVEAERRRRAVSGLE